MAARISANGRGHTEGTVPHVSCGDEKEDPMNTTGTHHASQASAEQRLHDYNIELPSVPTPLGAYEVTP